MFRLVFRICFLVLTLWSGYAGATFIPESEIQAAYDNYKKKYGQGQVFENISPAVAFANWYYQTSHEKNPDGAADALYRILFTSEGVGGISKMHQATPIETSIILSLYKRAKPSGTTKIPLGIDAAERAHQEFPLWTFFQVRTPRLKNGRMRSIGSWKGWDSQVQIRDLPLK